MDIGSDGHWVGWTLGWMDIRLNRHWVSRTLGWMDIGLIWHVVWQTWGCMDIGLDRQWLFGQMDIWLNGHWVRTFFQMNIKMKIELKISYWSWLDLRSLWVPLPIASIEFWSCLNKSVSLTKTKQKIFLVLI